MSLRPSLSQEDGYFAHLCGIPSDFKGNKEIPRYIKGYQDKSKEI